MDSAALIIQSMKIGHSNLLMIINRLTKKLQEEWVFMFSLSIVYVS